MIVTIGLIFLLAFMVNAVFAIGLKHFLHQSIISRTVGFRMILLIPPLALVFVLSAMVYVMVFVLITNIKDYLFD